MTYTGEFLQSLASIKILLVELKQGYLPVFINPMAKSAFAVAFAINKLTNKFCLYFFCYRFRNEKLGRNCKVHENDLRQTGIRPRVWNCVLIGFRRCQKSMLCTIILFTESVRSYEYFTRSTKCILTAGNEHLTVGTRNVQKSLFHTAGLKPEPVGAGFFLGRSGAGKKGTGSEFYNIRLSLSNFFVLQNSKTCSSSTTSRTNTLPYFN